MIISTRSFSKVKSEKRETYGREEFSRFQKAIRSLNIEKDAYWKHSNVNFFNKIEKKQPQSLLATKEKRSLKAHSKSFSHEKLAELIAQTSEKIYPSATLPQENALAYTLVFVNGSLALEHSNFPAESILLETEIHNTHLHKRYPNALHALVKHNHDEPNLMLKLNAALTALQEGRTSEQHEIFLSIPKNVALAKPLLCLFLDDTTAQEKITVPRIHLRLEQNASLTLLETHRPEHALLQSTFLNLTLEAGSKLIHVQELEEGDNVNHIHMTHGDLYHNSTYYAFVMQHGSQSSLIEKKFLFKGEGANATLNGLGLGRHRQHFNNIISLHHESEQTTSKQNYKFVLNDHARGAFTGSVEVYRDAQGVNSEQICKTLLIGEKAVMHTRPQLEIFADDVKCGHGATIGQVNTEELFYLTSRGISHEQALAILSHAFVKEFFTRLAETLDQKHAVNSLPARKTHAFLNNFF